MRPAREEDREWLYDVHVTTMRPSSADAREQFERRPETDLRIVTVDEVDVGAVHLGEDDDGSLRIGLLEIVPDHQGKGVGTSVIRALDEEAARAGAALTLRVRKDNRARALYDRLGFENVGEDATHVHMRRS